MDEKINGKTIKEFEDKIKTLDDGIKKSADLIFKAELENQQLAVKNLLSDIKDKVGRENKIRTNESEGDFGLFRKSRYAKLDKQKNELALKLEQKLNTLEEAMALKGLINKKDPHEAAAENMKNPQKPAFIMNSNGTFVPNPEYTTQNASEMVSGMKSGNQGVINGIAQKICQGQNMAVNAITEHTVLNQKEARLITNVATVGALIYLIKSVWDMGFVKGGMTVAATMLGIGALMKYMDPEQAAAVAANVGGIVPGVLPNTIKEPESYKKGSELFAGFTNNLTDEYKSGAKSQALLAEYIVADASGSGYTFDIDKLYNYLADEKNTEDAKLKFGPGIYQWAPAIRDQYNKGMRDQYNKGLTNFIKENGIDLTKDDVRSINSKHQNKLSDGIEQNKTNIMAWVKTLGYEIKNGIIPAEVATIYAQKDTLPSANIQAELAKLAKEGKINILSTEAKDKALLINTYIGATKCKDIANIDTVGGADGIVKAKNDATKFLISKGIPLINFDVINSNGHLYVQSDGMRVGFNIANGQAIIADEPFNNIQATNIEDAIKFGVAMCKMKTFLGKLSAYKVNEKDKDAKTVNSRFTYGMTISGMGIKIDEAGIDTGTFAALGGDQYIKETNTILDNTRSFANDKSQETAIKALNIIDQEFQQGKRRDEDDFALSYTTGTNGEYILHKVTAVNNTPNSVAVHGQDIALENFDEGSLRLQIKETLATIGGIGKDVVGGMYDGISGGMNQIQKDFRAWLSTEGKNWFELGEDALVRVGKDILKGIKYLGKRTLETMKSAAKWAVDTIFHGLGYTYDEVIELMQKNKLLAICVGALFGFGVAGLLGAGTIGATAIGGSIGAIIALASSQLSTPVTHPR